jgi:putative aldouronate transport system permease protein
MEKKIEANTRFKKILYKLTNAETRYQMLISFIIGALLIFCLYPLIYVFSASLMSEAEWVARDGLFLFPYKPIFDAYVDVFRQRDIFNAFGVSVTRVLIGAPLNVFICAITGYVLHLKDFFGRRILAIFLFVTMVYGGGMIPTYVTISNLGLLNSFVVFVIPGMLSGWTSLIFKQTFTSVPSTIAESARIDGSSDLRIFFQIMLPVNMPTLSVMLFFSAVGQWNSWFDAFLYIDNNNTSLIPLQLYLKNYFSQNSSSAVSAVQNLEAKKMVVAIVGILPILLIYPFFLKYFTKGVYMGAVKE